MQPKSFIKSGGNLFEYVTPLLPTHEVLGKFFSKFQINRNFRTGSDCNLLKSDKTVLPRNSEHEKYVNYWEVKFRLQLCNKLVSDFKPCPISSLIKISGDRHVLSATFFIPQSVHNLLVNNEKTFDQYCPLDLKLYFVKCIIHLNFFYYTLNNDYS